MMGDLLLTNIGPYYFTVFLLAAKTVDCGNNISVLIKDLGYEK